MDEKISKLFLPLLDKLYNTEPAGEPFRKPVDVVKYGCFDYYLYVKHPIDLSTIRDKLINHRYNGDAWRFIADINLMFANAYLFNKKGTPVYEFTNKLSKIWNSESAPIMQRLNYCCGTLHKFGPQLLFCHGTTSDRYCQIPIGAKYKCYQDQYSFCMPCFNKIDSDYINIQNLSCETTRMKLPTQPVKKSDFNDCANDHWQYESFVQCTQCTRRVHEICDLYPAHQDEIDNCIQHDELEIEQKMLCQVPEEYSSYSESKQQSSDEEIIIIKRSSSSTTTTQHQQLEKKPLIKPDKPKIEAKAQESRCQAESSSQENNPQNELLTSPTSLDDELLQFARDVDDFAESAPTSPNPEDNKNRDENHKENCQKKANDCQSDSPESQSIASNSSSSSIAYNSVSAGGSCSSVLNAKNSVDNIAARLSINKLSIEAPVEDSQNKTESTTLCRDKFVCNHCYRKKKIGFNLRHRKYSARRLPHTRMSRYIETKVNEHIRDHSPTAGEVTIRVLTAYRDTIPVKTEMNDYVKQCRQRGAHFSHPNVNSYPTEFAYTNRAIFAWQEIDGVDVCVFGMHVQEYGDDCPEPNRQVVYLSYLDSVHFFRPKQVRTAVYHEILLSYFKYVKKLGFRRVFIWVCPSRKGDDYIFYRHPTEQKMPTLKRLSDWYVSLLDKGIMAGIVERHQNIYQYASSENWTSILDIPYLSGDYWPGEFERLLNLMIESRKAYEVKMKQSDVNSIEHPIRLQDISELTDCGKINNASFNLSPIVEGSSQRLLSHSSIYQKHPPNSTTGNNFDIKQSPHSPFVQRHTNGPTGTSFTLEGDFCNITNDDMKAYRPPFTPDSSRSDSEQPLDLSKSSANTSPDSYFDDDLISELSFNSMPSKKKRKKSNTFGYTKKRSRGPVSNFQNTKSNRQNQFSLAYDGLGRFCSQPSRSSSRQKPSTQNREGSEILMNPEEELIKNLERSLKRQREGFIVARLNDCDCSPHFENQRRKEEAIITCELMKGREPFLQLARQKNFEFSTLRRAKYSSLAMVKHLGLSFKLEPICNECYSFDSSKRHFACPNCDDYYLCTSCHENTHHEHIMSLMTPSPLPDIDEFLQQCSLSSTTNSISSASSTISNKSFNETNLDASLTTPRRKNLIETSTPLSRNTSNALSGTMPLSCKRQKNHSFETEPFNRTEDEENAKVCAFDDNTTKHSLPSQPVPPPSHSSSNIRGINNFQQLELDQVLVDNFIRNAEVTYDVDFEQMKNESKKLLSHYWSCPIKETCHKCKFVILSCSFMSVLMKSTRMQMMISCNPNEITSNTSSTNNNNNLSSGINLTTAHRYSYQPKDK